MMYYSKIFKPIKQLPTLLKFNITVQQQNLHKQLQEVDPQLFQIIQKERHRQNSTLSLIPFENHTSNPVNQALGSIMNSKYSEGLPNNRYYGGNEYIDQMEILCQDRALETFNLNKKEWGINVQCLSGSPANFYTVAALLQNHDRLMSLSSSEGGHLSHGFNNGRDKVSAVSKYFEVINYGLKHTDNTIDYDQIQQMARQYLPKVIMGGANVYPRQIDYQRLKQICNEINAQLVVDISDVAGLISANILQSPFPYADVVTACTHKSLRGPRGALVFYNLKDKNLKTKIENAIFPGNQGGPHNHTITSIAVALKEAQSAEFKQYCQQVVKNAKVLSSFLKSKGFQVLTGGTDNHLVSIDLTNKGLKGEMVEEFFEKVNILVNGVKLENIESNVIHLGTLDLTTRGCKEQQIEQIGQFINEGCEILKEQENMEQKIQQLQKRVEQFALQNSYFN